MLRVPVILPDSGEGVNVEYADGTAGPGGVALTHANNARIKRVITVVTLRLFIEKPFNLRSLPMRVRFQLSAQLQGLGNRLSSSWTKFCIN